MFRQRRPPGGDHFRHQEARENAILFRQMIFNAHAGAFLAAEQNLAFIDQRANIFESHGRFENGPSAFPGDRVEQMRGGYAAGDTQLAVATGLQQIIEHQPENVIRRNERAIAIYNAEAIRIAVGGKPRHRASGGNFLAQFSDVILGRVGPGAIKKHVAVCADGGNRNSMAREEFIKVAGAAAVQRVIDEMATAFLDHVEANQFFDLREIWLARVER